MSLPILKGAAGWPQVLLARAAAGAVADIEAAEAAGAWGAFRKATRDLSPEVVLHTSAESGLAGRGGAGYPTGAKWRDCVTQPDPVHYVVANGFEADPGAQADRTLMELSLIHISEPTRPVGISRMPSSA